MARSMQLSGDAFRARIVIRLHDGSTLTTFQGPYATAGAAKTRLTWAKRIYKDRLVEAVVERTGTDWQPI